MTTTPLPPLPNLRGGIVKHTILGELYDRLQVEQRMVAYATQARADLEAENQRLREALEKYIAWCDAESDGKVDFWERVQMCRDSEAAARSALEQQP